MKYHYKVDISWSTEDNCYVASIPELKGCMTDGSTYAEAAKHAEEAIESWLTTAKRHKEPIPVPLALKKMSGKFLLRVPEETHRRLTLKAREEHVSLNHIASTILTKYAS